MYVYISSHDTPLSFGWSVHTFPRKYPGLGRCWKFDSRLSETWCSTQLLVSPVLSGVSTLRFVACTRYEKGASWKVCFCRLLPNRTEQVAGSSISLHLAGNRRYLIFRDTKAFRLTTCWPVFFSHARVDGVRQRLRPWILLSSAPPPSREHPFTNETKKIIFSPKHEKFLLGLL